MAKKKNIAVIGASGRMGTEIGASLHETKNLTPFLGVTRKQKAIGYEKSAIGLKENDFKNVDLIIDFSGVEQFEATIKFAEKMKIPLVSGITGLSEVQKKSLQKVAKTIPVLWAPNMSLGVAVLTNALKALKGIKHFDFQVEELHHSKKKDKPSGTGLFLQKNLESVLGKKCPEIVAIRGGGIFGVHRIYAMSENETLTFEHTALNRKLFADGAVQAADWLLKQKPGLFEMKDVLNQ